MHCVTMQAPNTVENYKVKCCLEKKKIKEKHTNLEQNQVKTGHGKKHYAHLAFLSNKCNFRPGRKHKPKREKVKTVKFVFYYIIILWKFSSVANRIVNVCCSEELC